MSWVHRSLAAVRRDAVPIACWLLFFALGAVLSAQSAYSIPVAAPPGTSSTILGTGVGWLLFLFGIGAIALIVIGAVKLAMNPGHGGWGLIMIGICIIIAGASVVVVNAIYRPGT